MAQLTVAQIDRDYINDKDDKAVGENWTFEVLTDLGWFSPMNYGDTTRADVENAPKVRFRILDDDNVVYYGGWLLNDDACSIQDAVRNWAMYDSGAPWIEVKINDEWKREIS